MSQPCLRNLRPLALAQVLMKLAESCVIEQHIDKFLQVVQLANLGLGTSDDAALIVRTVRGWASDIAPVSRRGLGGDVILPIDGIPLQMLGGREVCMLTVGCSVFGTVGAL